MQVPGTAQKKHKKKQRSGAGESVLRAHIERFAHLIHRPDPSVFRRETEYHIDSFEAGPVFIRMSRST